MDKANEFPIWKTLLLGIFQSPEDVRSVFGHHPEYKISIPANEMVKRVTFTSHFAWIDLVKISTKNLGFYNGGTGSQIYEKAKNLGLDLCPAEVGVLLRFFYIDQPLNEKLTIAMQTILGQYDCPGVFVVDRDSNHSLLSETSGFGSWGPEEVWVFAKKSNA